MIQRRKSFAITLGAALILSGIVCVLMAAAALHDQAHSSEKIGFIVTALILIGSGSSLCVETAKQKEMPTRKGKGMQTIKGGRFKLFS